MSDDRRVVMVKDVIPSVAVPHKVFVHPFGNLTPFSVYPTQVAKGVYRLVPISPNDVVILRRVGVNKWEAELDEELHRY